MPLWTQGYAGTPAFFMYPDGFVAGPNKRDVMPVSHVPVPTIRECLIVLIPLNTADTLTDFYLSSTPFATGTINLNWSGSSPMGGVVTGVRVQQTCNEF